MLPNRYEQHLAAFATSPDSVAAALAAAAHRTRHELLADAVPRELKALHHIAIDVAGPFLVSYCLWLLRRAVEERLDRLYFISRDGEVLWRVSQVLADTLGISVDLRYLYGGRLAWQRPALAVGADRETIVSLVTRMLFGVTVVRLSGLAVRLGLPTRMLQQALSTSRPGGAEDDRPLSPDELARLHSALTADEGIKAIREGAAASLPPTLAYLRQEGLLDGSPWALVDVGWRGNTVQALNELLRFGGGCDARVFFTGYVGAGGADRLPKCEAFIWDIDHADPLPCPPGAMAIVEALCSGAHGSVVGYSPQGDGSVRPLLLSEFSQARENWFLEELRSALMVFLENLTPHLRSAHLMTADPRAALAVMQELCERPSRDEAHVLGSCPREEDAQGDSVFPLARGYQLADLPGLLRPGPRFGRNLGWSAGALALTPSPTRDLVQVTLAAAGAARRLRLPDV